jgi:hypothetical protein
MPHRSLAKSGLSRRSLGEGGSWTGQHFGFRHSGFGFRVSARYPSPLRFRALNLD